MLKRLNILMNKSDALIPWLSLAGCLFFLIGLGLDGILHRLDHYLAVSEGVITLANPSHLLMAVGIGLFVLSTILFLVNQVKQLKRRSLFKQILLLGAIFGIVGLCGINLVLGIKDNSPLIQTASAQNIPISIDDAINLSKNADYSFYSSENSGLASNSGNQSPRQTNQLAQQPSAHGAASNLPTTQPKSGVYYIESQHSDGKETAATSAESRLEPPVINTLIIDLGIFGLIFLLSFFIKEPALVAVEEIANNSLSATKTAPRKSTAFNDLLLISTVCIVVFVLAIIFDLFEELQKFIIQYRSLRLDEILVVLIMLGFAFAIFSLKRWLELKEEIKERKAIALQNAQLFQQAETSRERAQRLAQMLVEAQETERRRVAYELHDEVGQALTAIKINLQISRRNPAAQPILSQIEDSISIVEQALQQVRNISFDLRPSMLDDLGLAAALSSYTERLTERIGLTPRISVKLIETRVAPFIETTCYRIAQEALTNILRHAQAQEVCVELQQADKELVLVISDDGKGFELDSALERANKGKSLGLLGMQERTSTIGGNLEIASSPNKGTKIVARFPLTIPQVLQSSGV